MRAYQYPAAFTQADEGGFVVTFQTFQKRSPREKLWSMQSSKP